MKPVMSKIGIPFASAVVGGLLVALVMKHTKNEKLVTVANLQESAVATLIKQRQELRKRLMDSIFSDPFTVTDSFPDLKDPELISNGGTDPVVSALIQKREDDQYVYYDVKVPEPNATSLITKVERRYLTISGQLKSELPSKAGSYQSVFQETFPLPDDVIASSLQTSASKNKIVLKFQKEKLLSKNKSASNKVSGFAVSGSVI